MKAAWQKCALSFSKRDFLEIPRGMYWPSSTLWDRGSGMKSLSHNQSLQGAEHIRRLAPPTNTVISSGYTDWHHWRACALCRSVTNAIEGYQWGRLVEIRSQHSEVQVKKQSWPWMSKDTAAWAHPWKKWAHVLAIKAVDQRKRILVFAASRSKWSFAWNPSLVRSFAISYKINTIGFFRPFFAPSLVDSVSHWQSCEIFLPSEDSQTLPFCLSEKEEFALYVNMSPWKWL